MYHILIHHLSVIHPVVSLSLAFKTKARTGKDLYSSSSWCHETPISKSESSSSSLEASIIQSAELFNRYYYLPNLRFSLETHVLHRPIGSHEQLLHAADVFTGRTDYTFKMTCNNMTEKNKFNCFFILFFTGCVLIWHPVIWITALLFISSDIIVSWYVVYNCAKLRLKQKKKWMEVCLNICSSSLSWFKDQLH